jgi:hypothetical protein
MSEAVYCILSVLHVSSTVLWRAESSQLSAVSKAKGPRADRSAVYYRYYMRKQNECACELPGLDAECVTVEESSADICRHCLFNFAYFFLLSKERERSWGPFPY